MVQSFSTEEQKMAMNVQKKKLCVTKTNAGNINYQNETCVEQEKEVNRGSC